MKGLVKNILTIGITVGLADREAFISKVSEMIREYQDDPTTAEKWAGAITQHIEEMKDDFRTQKVIENSIANSGLPDKKSIEDLTIAIEHLTQILNEKKRNNA